MSLKINEEALIKEKFATLSQHYELLGTRLKNSLETLLNKLQIPFHKIEFRVKSFDSFFHKIKRYDQKDPFNQIDDICGLRIICFYYSDLFRINQRIKDEFDVLEFDIKSTDIDIAKFAYRSWHYILKFKEEWINELEDTTHSDFRAEIQLRTISMHTWAEIEHEISYKQDIPTSDIMKRHLSKISALLEMVDEQFDQIREERAQYLDSLRFQPRVDFKTLELSFENFQKLLDAYYPYRVSSLKDSTMLYHEITQLGVNMKDLVYQIKRSKEILPVIEEDRRLELLLAEQKFVTDEERLLKLGPLKMHQSGALRIILYIFHDRYWESKRGDVPINAANFINKWRAKLRGP